MLVMVVFFIAFRWIHLSTPLIRLFLLVLILLLMPTLNFLPVWFALSLLRDRKSGSAGMPRPISYAVFCFKKNKLPGVSSCLPFPVDYAVTGKGIDVCSLYCHCRIIFCIVYRSLIV